MIISIRCISWAGWLAVAAAPLLPFSSLAAGKVALLIGNKDYKEHSPLANPLNDIDAVGKELEHLGFEVTKRKNLRRAEMSEAISQFVDTSNGADVALFYFAGHGAQPPTGGPNYMMPVDAERLTTVHKITSHGITTDGTGGIVQLFEAQSTPAKIRLVLIDACRHNPLGDDSTRGERGMLPPKVEARYTLVSYSTGSNTRALDEVNGSRLSPYAEAVVSQISAINAEPVMRVFEAVAESVSHRTNGKQEPAIYTNMKSTLMLSGAHAKLTSETPDASAWQLAERINNREGYEQYLKLVPNGEHAIAARQKIEEFGKQKQASPTRIEMLPGTTVYAESSSSSTSSGSTTGTVADRNARLLDRMRRIYEQQYQDTDAEPSPPVFLPSGRGRSRASINSISSRGTVELNGQTYEFRSGGLYRDNQRICDFDGRGSVTVSSDSDGTEEIHVDGRLCMRTTRKVAQ